MAAPQADGRRTVLELTEGGEAEHDRFAAELRQAFEDITADWSYEERQSVHTSPEPEPPKRLDLRHRLPNSDQQRAERHGVKPWPAGHHVARLP
jgi:DNA-binding MarR family transcriptional regulator